MDIRKESNDYILKLNGDEVLVFFEWIVKFNKDNELSDKAEQKILSNLECLLESVLEEPFMEDYKEIINQAKRYIIDNSLLWVGSSLSNHKVDRMFKSCK